MATHPAAALRTFGQLRCMPTVCGLAGAQTHLGCFSFRYSHSNSLPSVQIQMVERIPGIRRFGIFDDVQVFQPRPDALGLPVPIAMRMNWKSEEDILTNPRRQVDQFGSGQLDLSGKVFDANRKNESLKATDAFQPDIHSDFSRHEQTGSRHADIERIFDRPQWPNLIFLQLQDVGFFFAFEVNALPQESA